jgi:transcriptional regulator with XRE-family HTH domain
LRKKGEWKTCPKCRTRVWVSQWKISQWRTCGRQCDVVARRKLPPWNPLQVRCLERIAETHLTVRAFARAAGISDVALRHWFRRRGSTTSAQTLRKLAEVLGIPEEQALAEAGGRTAEDSRVDRARKARAVPRDPIRMAQAHRKAGDALRGKPKSPEHIAASVAFWENRSAEAKARGVEALIAGSRSAKGRALHGLYGRLRHTPTPSREQLATWAQTVGERLGLPPDAVLAIWKPYLQKRGLIGTAGRPRLERRHRIIVDSLTTCGLTPDGRIPTSFWGRALSELEQVEKHPPRTVESVRQWWIDHKRACLSCVGAAAERRKL